MEGAMDRAIAQPLIGGIGVPELALDDIALRAQLEAHHAESFGWALFCCRHCLDDAENVLQIVYLKVLGRRAVFDGRSSFKTWLFSVIRHTAAGERRTELFHRLLLREFFLGQSTPHSGPSGEDLASSNQVQQNLRRALLKLPLRQREVLHLVFYQDLSIQDAANVMRIGIGSARRHYERAKKQMRRYLEAGARS